MMITEEGLSDEEMYRQDLYRNIKTVRDLFDAYDDDEDMIPIYEKYGCNMEDILEY